MSDLAWLILLVLIGPFVGSFLGLVSVRLPRGLPVVFGRSACPGCERTLGPLDLVPIASFTLFHGRCRTCAAPIPRRYLALELACPALALWAGLTHPGAEGALGALYAWQLLLLALLDAEHFWLPRLLTLPLIVTGLAAASLAGAGALADAALGAALGFLVLALIAWLYRRLRRREGLGGGDAYLLAGAGAWCGAWALPTIMIAASLSGLAAVLILRLVGRPVAGDQPVPFGVFLALGGWLAWLYGPLGL